MTCYVQGSFRTLFDLSLVIIGFFTLTSCSDSNYVEFLPSSPYTITHSHLYTLSTLVDDQYQLSVNSSFDHNTNLPFLELVVCSSHDPNVCTPALLDQNFNSFKFYSEDIAKLQSLLHQEYSQTSLEQLVNSSGIKKLTLIDKQQNKLQDFDYSSEFLTIATGSGIFAVGALNKTKVLSSKSDYYYQLKKYFDDHNIVMKKIYQIFPEESYYYQALSKVHKLNQFTIQALLDNFDLTPTPSIETPSFFDLDRIKNHDVEIFTDAFSDTVDQLPEKLSKAQSQFFPDFKILITEILSTLLKNDLKTDSQLAINLDLEKI